MKDLKILIENKELRKQLVADCVMLIDNQIQSKKGISGITVKTAYGLVRKLKPKMINRAVNSLLDDFARQLQTYYHHYQEEGSNGSLEQFFSARTGDVAESLLQITDQRANLSSNKTAVKVYHKLRPRGKEHVEIAVPEIGKLLDTFMINIP